MRKLRQDDKVPGAKYIGKWGNGSNINIFDVFDSNGFNSIIGLLKHKNNDGTVLYRGQCNLYEHLVPSIMHDIHSYHFNLLRLSESLNKMYNNNQVNDLFSWSKDINGWELYIKTTLEAALQHYGAKTRSVDFVDNHWTALWFALNEYNHKTSTYSKRIPGVYSPESDQLILSTSSVNPFQEAFGYIFLYLAETNVSEVNGMYLGKDTYTVDLRKALPHLFLRPIAQHGWVVLNKKTILSEDSSNDDSSIIMSSYIFDSDVVGILRMKTSLIDEMLGNGRLLSQENFFPPPFVDKGYEDLRSLQGNLLPSDMLETYHGT